MTNDKGQMEIRDTADFQVGLPVNLEFRDINARAPRVDRERPTGIPRRAGPDRPQFAERERDYGPAGRPTTHSPSKRTPRQAIEPREPKRVRVD